MEKIFRFFNRAEEIIASSLLLITSFLVFIQAVFRRVFNYSIAWSEETALLMIVWFIFLGSSIAVKENAHVNMDAVFCKLNGKTKKVISIVIDIICIVYCVLIVIGGYEFVGKSIALNSTATSIKMPLYIPYASVAVGAFLMGIRYVVKLITDLKTKGGTD